MDHSSSNPVVELDSSYNQHHGVEHMSYRTQSSGHLRSSYQFTRRSHAFRHSLLLQRYPAGKSLHDNLLYCFGSMGTKNSRSMRGILVGRHRRTIFTCNVCWTLCWGIQFGLSDEYVSRKDLWLSNWTDILRAGQYCNLVIASALGVTPPKQQIAGPVGMWKHVQLRASSETSKLRLQVVTAVSCPCWEHSLRCQWHPPRI